jgi:hypothetical protein
VTIGFLSDFVDACDEFPLSPDLTSRPLSPAAAGTTILQLSWIVSAASSACASEAAAEQQPGVNNNE